MEREIRAEIAAETPECTFDEAIEVLDGKLQAFGMRQDSKRLAAGWTKTPDGDWIPPGYGPIPGWTPPPAAAEGEEPPAIPCDSRATRAVCGGEPAPDPIGKADGGEEPAPEPLGDSVDGEAPAPDPLRDAAGSGDAGLDPLPGAAPDRPLMAGPGGPLAQPNGVPPVPPDDPDASGPSTGV
jgi:hypothetical protein